MPTVGPGREPRRTTALARLHPAVRLGATVLAVVTVFAVPPWGVPVTALAAAAGLAATGLGWGRQLASLRPWLPVGTLVILIHLLTTTTAAPLGHPSWSGLLAGAVALARVGASVGWLALLMRVTDLNELAGAVAWWLTPLRRVGLRGDDVPVVLTVAMGTAPAVLAEARRIESAVALRRGLPGDGGVSWWRRQIDRARVVAPLCETVMRRADALSLTLRRRRPASPDLGRPGWPGVVLLAGWTAALVGRAVLATGGGRW